MSNYRRILSEYSFVPSKSRDCVISNEIVSWRGIGTAAADTLLKSGQVCIQLIATCIGQDGKTVGTQKSEQIEFLNSDVFTWSHDT
jgi:hypothetical protein